MCFLNYNASCLVFSFSPFLLLLLSLSHLYPIASLSVSVFPHLSPTLLSFFFVVSSFISYLPSSYRHLSLISWSLPPPQLLLFWSFPVVLPIPFPLSPFHLRSKHQLDLPTTPLGIPSSATFCVINQGYGDLELKHRISPTVPIELLVTYPDGPDIGTSTRLFSIFTVSFQ